MRCGSRREASISTKIDKRSATGTTAATPPHRGDRDVVEEGCGADGKA
jgi:hypothetical protein